MLKKRLLALLLVLALLFSFTGCAAGKAEETTVPTGSSFTEEEQKILSERRDIAEAYMRQMGSVLWRATETFEYDCYVEGEDKSRNLKIVAGRLYQGIPYSYGGSAGATFMEFLGEPDENGIYTAPEIANDEDYPEYFQFGVLGNDCSSSVHHAWAQFGASIQFVRTKNMAADYGFIPVGEYQTKSDDITNSAEICTVNGKDVMFAAYAQLQKADAVVYRASAGHSRMVTKVDVVYNEDGTINGAESTITTLEQTSGSQKDEKNFFSPEVGETVYEIYKLDKVYTFAELYRDGYLPVTCKELIDPSPVAEPEIKDSLTEFNKDTILTGTISCNWTIDKVTVVISDANGNEVQRAGVKPLREENYEFDMADRFADDTPFENRVIGSVDVAKLAAGEYRCVVYCRLSTGMEYTVRDFTFTV